MDDAANPHPPVDPDDEARLVEAAEALADALDGVLASWIERLVLDTVRECGGIVTPEIAARAALAGEDARTKVMPWLRELLAIDIDLQRDNPLAVLRRATEYAAVALDELGVPARPRDAFAERHFPGDRFGLVPAGWDDIDDSLVQPGITWSAAKAFVFKARRRAEGRQ